MASLGFVYGLLLGNCGYQTDRKIYDQRASHSACDPFVICADKIINSLLLATAKIIRAMEYAFFFVLTIAVLWLIMKLSCFFIEQVFIWIYTFISFGFWLIFFPLGIASTSAFAVCSFSWSFVSFLACVLITFAVVSVWLNPKGEYIYYICTEIYCKMNMSNKNDALQSTRNLIGCTIFLTSEKYRMTNHNPQTKVFTSDKNCIDFPAFH